MTACPSTTPSTPRPARFAKSSTGGELAALARGGPAIARRDRVLGARSRARRRAAAPRRASTPSATTTLDAALIRPVVTVPVLSSTTVSTRRVDSRTSGPLMSSPSWAPRPVPTSSAVGVASPSAHGQAMISTATAAVKAKLASRRRRARTPSVADGERDHDRHEDAGDAVGEPLDRRLAGLRVGRRARAICASAVSAPTRVGADDEPAAGVHGRARDLVARAAPRPGRVSPVSSAWSTAERPSSTTPSVATFSPGRTTKRSPTASSLDRDAALGAVGAEHGDVLGARARAARAARRRRGAWRAPRSSGRRAGTS